MSNGGNAIDYEISHVEAEEGIVVAINAGINPGYEFAYWSSDVEVVFADVYSPYTTFVMVGENVRIMANWRRVEVPTAQEDFDNLILLNI